MMDLTNNHGKLTYKSGNVQRWEIDTDMTWRTETGDYDLQKWMFDQVGGTGKATTEWWDWRLKNEMLIQG